MNHLGGYLHKYLVEDANENWIATIVSTKIEDSDDKILNGVIGMVESLGLSRTQYYVTYCFFFCNSCFLNLIFFSKNTLTFWGETLGSILFFCGQRNLIWITHSLKSKTFMSVSMFSFNITKKRCT